MPVFPRPESEGGGERGFVLIAAVWLLILAGSIVAILMLRSLAGASVAADHQAALQRRLTQESAAETVLADILFHGERSPWWRTPVVGAVAVGGRRVGVRLSSETGRLDLNEADPALIDTALRGLRVAPGERARIVARLQALRTARRRIESHAEFRALLAGGGPAAGCLEEHFTVNSGYAEPRPDQLSDALARALGRSVAAGPSPPEPGTALRFETAEPGSATMMVIARIAGTSTQPIAVGALAIAAPCAR